MYELKPLSVGEILDATFSFYRRHFATLLTIVAVCIGPGAILRVYVELGGGFVVHPWAGLLYLLVSFIGSLLASGATLRVISDIYLGRELDVREALEEAVGKSWPLFVAGMATALLAGLAALLLVVPGIIVWCGYSLAPQVVVLEDVASGTEALPRSWALTKGFKGKVFSLISVMALLMFVPLVGIGAVFPGGTGEVVGILLQILLSPAFYTVMTLLYYDLRVRKEGFDLELLGRLTDEYRASA